VAVIAEGGIAELGSHDDLVAGGGHYASLFAAWQRGLAGINSLDKADDE
jgi:ABC-type multidrug transport system fused ATPase/permease subunit